MVVKARHCSDRRAASRPLAGSAASEAACGAAGRHRGAGARQIRVNQAWRRPQEQNDSPSGHNMKAQAAQAAAAPAHRVCELGQQVAQPLLGQRQVAHGAPLVLRDEHLQGRAGQRRLAHTKWGAASHQIEHQPASNSLNNHCAITGWQAGRLAGCTNTTSSVLQLGTDLEAQDAGKGAQGEHQAEDAGQRDAAHRQHLAAQVAGQGAGWEVHEEEKRVAAATANTAAAAGVGSPAAPREPVSDPSCSRQGKGKARQSPT